MSINYKMKFFSQEVKNTISFKIVYEKQFIEIIILI